jgi:PAS domain S-box-containing protein
LLVVVTDLLSIAGIVIAVLIRSRFFKHLYTELDNTLSRLQKSEALTKKIIDSSLDCIISMDLDGKIVEFNPAAEKTFGYSCEEVLGKEMASIIIPSRLREAHRNGLAHYLATGAGPVMDRRIEMPALGRSGNEFPMELTIVRTQVDENPNFTGFLRDITDRKQWEEDKNEAIRARDELIAVVSHELKNPLTAIGTGILLIKRSAVSLSKEYPILYRACDNIDASVRRMSRLVSDLLDAARIEAGHLKLEPKTVGVTDLLRETIQTFLPLVGEKKIRLDQSISPSLPMITCDKDRIIQVLSNLIDNAIKFTREGGSILVKAELQGDLVRFEVKDSGTGIAEDNLLNVFDRYWQAKQFAFRGTGLGLSIAKGLVEAHGGRIWVESRVGMGSSFYFTLPTRDLARKSTVAAA